MRIGLGIGLNRNRKASGVGEDPALTALLAKAATDGATPASGDALVALNILLTTMRSEGILSKLDLFYVFATNGDEAFARYNIIDPDSYQCTTTGSPTFTSLQGFSGNAATDPRLNTGYAALTDSVQYAKDAASVGCYLRTNGAEGGYSMYGKGGAIRLRMGTQARQWLNGITDLAVAPVASATGWYHMNRADANDIDFRINNVANVQAQASSDVGTGAITLLSDGGANGTTSQMSIAFVGGDLSSEATAFYNAVVAYMNSIGSAV